MKNKSLKFAKFRRIMNSSIDFFTKNEYSTAIVTAAGSGNRMGGISKQLLELNGIPCIAYSLMQFQNFKRINEIIIAAKKSEIIQMKEICEKYGITKCVNVIEGGNTRRESIKNAFSYVSDKSQFLFIHDAARPCITNDDIEKLFSDASKYGAATASSPAVDSLKICEDGFIKSSIDRNSVRLVQTPQVFKTDIYRVALAIAEKKNIDVTDDNALVENAGFRIKLSDTGKYNIKLTTPDDVKIIENILRRDKWISE